MVKKMSDVRIAVVGCGRWGRNLVRNFDELGALSYICDTDGSLLDEARTEMPVGRARDYRLLLNEPSVHGVAIATPSGTHYKIAREFLLAGKDVLVEKPMALSVDEGTELVAVAEERRRVLLVGHLLEYHPAILKLKEIVDSGELGRVNYISSTRLDFGNVQQGSDVLWTFAPHDIDTILLLVKRAPVSVTTIGGDYIESGAIDVSVNTLDFGGGLKALLLLSWLYPYKERKLVVVGDRGMAVFDDVGKDKLTLYPNTVVWQQGRPITKMESGQVVETDGTEPLRLECQDFIRCVASRSRPRVSTTRAIQVLKLLVACQMSARGGGLPVIMDPVALSGHFVHPTATVDDGASIGKGTKVWHYCHVSAGAVIGERCVLGQNVYIAPNVRIGDGVRIQNNVSVYEGVTLEDDVFCGPSCVFTNDKYPSTVADNRNRWLKTLVKKGAVIGANATILCGITIGRHALVGAGAVVIKDVLDGVVVYGNPAEVKKDKGGAGC